MTETPYYKDKKFYVVGTWLDRDGVARDAYLQGLKLGRTLRTSEFYWYTSSCDTGEPKEETTPFELPEAMKWLTVCMKQCENYISFRLDVVEEKSNGGQQEV